MEKIFTDIDFSFSDLKSQQSNKESLEICKLFSNEIEVTIFQNNGVLTFYIHEDAQHQMIVVDSPLTGPRVFEYNPDRD